MEEFDRKTHWEKIYTKKSPEEVSWYQPLPATSLDFVELFGISKAAKIIDVGGGESFLVDHLLDRGYKDITVLDISATALEKVKRRLGGRAESVKWIVTDVTFFKPTVKYDLWHDRATFHFLTEDRDISDYVKTVAGGVAANGALVIGTFSEQGPKKCSGIDVKQYSEKSMDVTFGKYFEKVKYVAAKHETPFNTAQDFVFCGFKRSV